MESKTIIHNKCPFCGKEITTRYVYDDGVDWMGHGRGRPSVEEKRENCRCEWGKLEHTLPKIKPMCLNCYYYNNGFCENKEERKFLEEYNNFDIKIQSMKVKDSTKSCKHYELNYGIFDNLIK